MQKITIAGNVGKDAVLNTGGQDPVLNFSVAVSNGKDKDATWYDCSLWGKRAESLHAYIKKGTKISLDGKPGVRVHEGKAYLKITVGDLTLQSSASERSDSAEPPARSSKPATSDDDIPF